MLKNIKYYIWHNPVMDKLESLTSKLNVWFWQKRWGDRNLYCKCQKKRHLGD